MTKRRRCGCVEQFKGLNCPACYGSGQIPPVENIRVMFAEADLRDVLTACEKATWRVSPRILTKLHIALVEVPSRRKVWKR